MSWSIIDKDRMEITNSQNIPNNYYTNLMKEFEINLDFHNYTNINDIFISKSKKTLFFPKFNYDQSNMKCLLSSEFNIFVLILQNIRPDLIYLNESIQIHLSEKNEMFLPKINILNNKKLPRLIVVPIDIIYYNNKIRTGGHKNVIIINTLLKTITFFEPYGIDIDNTESNVIFNIIQDYYSNLLPNYTFIDAIVSNTKNLNKMYYDYTINDKYDNYYIKINRYINELNNVRLNENSIEQKNKIKKLQEKIKIIQERYKDKINKKNNNKNYTVEKFTNKGPQKRQEMIEYFEGGGGHCVGWSLYLVFLTFINVNLFSKFEKNISISSFINDLLLEKINGKSIEPYILSNLIRQFISYVLHFNKTFNNLIVSKSKSSKVIHLIFNLDGGYTIIPPTPIYSKVSNTRSV
jgi:hypothetical protein